MNKRLLLLISVLLVLTSTFSYKIYTDAKKELRETIIYSAKLKKEATEIIEIQKLKKIKPPYFCGFSKNRVECKNMDRRKFYIFQNFLKKAFLKKFDIEKNRRVNAVVELSE